jgi:lysozyme
MMTPARYAELVADVKKAEGWRSHAYRDSVGVWTVGFGTNLQEIEIDVSLGEQWLLEAIGRSTDECRRAFPWFTTLTDSRQAVLVEMTYNLGLPGLLKFHRMLIAVMADHFDAAADEMLESLWARQVGQRAVRLAQQMREG